MKYFISLVFCLLVVMLAFGVETVSRISDFEKLINVKVFELNQTIEAQEKEIRLLKTDVYILENGYERNAEN